VFGVRCNPLRKQSQTLPLVRGEGTRRTARKMILEANCVLCGEPATDPNLVGMLTVYQIEWLPEEYDSCWAHVDCWEMFLKENGKEN
jgi:hypothetical protein